MMVALGGRNNPGCSDASKDLHDDPVVCLYTSILVVPFFLDLPTLRIYI